MSVSRSADTARRLGIVTKIATHFRTIRRKKTIISPEVGPNIGLIIRQSQLIIRKRLILKTRESTLTAKRRIVVLNLLLEKTTRLTMTIGDFLLINLALQTSPPQSGGLRKPNNVLLTGVTLLPPLMKHFLS